MQLIITDAFKTAISNVQTARQGDYMIWAMLPDGVEMPVSTVRLPISSSLDEASRRVEEIALDALAKTGITEAEFDRIELLLDELLSEAEVRALIDAKANERVELALLDFPTWESVRRRMQLPITKNELSGEEEMVIGDVRLQRSAVT